MITTPTSDRSRPRALRLLSLVLVAVAAYATTMVLAGGTVDRLFAALGFGMADAGVTGGPAREHVLLLQGVLGAVILGWVATMLGIVRQGLTSADPDPWWRLLTGSLVLWFAVDTGFSLAIGAWQHGVFNTAFAMALAIPLWALRPQPTLTARA